MRSIYKKTDRGLSTEWEKLYQENSWETEEGDSEGLDIKSGVGSGYDPCAAPTLARVVPGSPPALEESPNEPHEMHCQNAWHCGDEYKKECDRCRKAICLRRKHENGKSVSRNVLSVDLSGPHPETTGTSFRYMMVAVFK